MANELHPGKNKWGATLGSNFMKALREEAENTIELGFESAIAGSEKRDQNITNYSVIFCLVENVAFRKVFVENDTLKCI
jgi:hypothetical protein